MTAPAPALQAERTVLAWRRTLPAVCLCLAALVRAALVHPHIAHVGAVAGVGRCRCGGHRRRDAARRYRRRAEDPRPLGLLIPAAVSLAVLASAGAALAAPGLKLDVPQPVSRSDRGDPLCRNCHSQN